MPFGIPSEDFHGGFGLPHDDEIPYVVHANTGEKRGSVVIDNFHEVFTNRANELVIDELKKDKKELLERLCVTAAALSVALRDYHGPYRKSLEERYAQAVALFIEKDGREE